MTISLAFFSWWNWKMFPSVEFSVFFVTEPESDRKCIHPVNGPGTGNRGVVLTDGSTSTCAVIQRSDECCKAEYSFIVNGSCIHDNTITIIVTMETGSVCDALTSVMFVSKVSQCGGNVKRGLRCEITSTDVIDDKPTCSMRCECADSADQCLVHLYSGLNQVDVKICEIQIEDWTCNFSKHFFWETEK